MERRRYPIGIQSFEKIRTGNYVYVDKTQYVYDITNHYSYVFLNRPRRFGKSLLTSTLESYFLGQEKLFKGLAIDSLETEWKTYPVLHFDMSSATYIDAQQLQRELNLKLLRYEEIYGKGEGEVDLNQRLSGIISRARKSAHAPVVVLIDEYDKPLLDVITDDDMIKSMRLVMRNFYSPLKSCGDDLRFVFITGITKFSQVSIFSELNNLKNISMMQEYSAICGISQSEIENQLMEDVHQVSEKLKISPDETLALLKRTYDGYHFSEDAEDIYNPFSLLNALSDKKINNYWFSTGTPTFLINLIKKFGIDIRMLDHAETFSSEFDAPTESMTSILPILYQSGYITIKGYNRATDFYRLGMPNKEVAFGLMNALIPYYVSPDKQVTLGTMGKMYEDLLHHDMDAALNRLKVFMAGLPYELENKTEKHFQTIIYVIFKMMTKYVDVEISTATGRIDLMLQTDTCIYVMEFKLDKTAEEAIAQIDTKDYLIPYTLDSRKLVKVGINFSSETRTLDNWVIRDA